MKRYYKRDKSGLITVSDGLSWNEKLLLEEFGFCDGSDENIEEGELTGWPDSKVTWYLNCFGGFDIGIPMPTRQEKHLAKLVRRNGFYFNPADSADAARLAKFDALPNKTEAIKKWLDSLDN